MSDVEINVGTQGSRIQGSDISINSGDANVDRKAPDFYERLKDLERDVREIRAFLAGSPLGEPGLTAKVNSALVKIGQIEKEFVGELDEHKALIRELSQMLATYRPMLEEMQATYRSKMPVSIAVFYGTIFLLFIATFLVVYLGRG